MQQWPYGRWDVAGGALRSGLAQMLSVENPARAREHMLGAAAIRRPATVPHAPPSCYSHASCPQAAAIGIQRRREMTHRGREDVRRGIGSFAPQAIPMVLPVPQTNGPAHQQTNRPSRLKTYSQTERGTEPILPKESDHPEMTFPTRLELPRPR
jgi:hypothetical protein